MNENDRTKKSPRAALPVDVKHSQYLQKSDASYGGSSEHLAVAPYRQHHHRRHDHD